MLGDFMIWYMQSFTRFSHYLSQQLCVHKYKLVSKTNGEFKIYECARCGRTKVKR